MSRMAVCGMGFEGVRAGKDSILVVHAGGVYSMGGRLEGARTPNVNSVGVDTNDDDPRCGSLESLVSCRSRRPCSWPWCNSSIPAKWGPGGGGEGFGVMTGP